MTPLTDGRCQSLLDAIHFYAICYLDPVGAVLSWNRGAQEITGYSPEQIIGQSFARFYTYEDRQAQLPAQALRSACEDKGYEQQAWRVRQDGTRFWAHIVMRADRDETGAIVGFSKITRDATHQPAIAEASGDWANQAAKIDTVGRLAGKVAHEFNNILAVVSGNLELAQKRLKSQRPVEHLLGNAMAAAAKAASLTSLMLACARRQTLRPGPVDLISLADRVAQDATAPIRIDLSATENVLFALADSMALEKALAALVTNAVEATDSGGEVRLTIRETATAPKDSGLEPGRYVVATVSDTGRGMDAETRRKAFEPFFTTKAVDRGTGLGLSMAQGFAVQSGGALLLKSQRDVGTEVELWLPAAPQVEIEDISEKASRTVTSRASQIALVVDDDPLVLETTSGLLEALGYQTLSARSGQDALHLLIEHPEITMLVTDDAMPGMAGVQLAAQAERVRPGMGVLLVSGYLDPSRYESVGPAVKFLAKPFDLQQLSTTLADLARLEALRPDCGGKRPVSEHGPRSRLASATLDRDSVGP